MRGIIISPKIIHKIHHEILKIIDSNKKMCNISVLFIQIDFKIQISLVLSATQANITFIIQIHDTTRTIIATQVKSKVIVCAES
jgi:hypothetical protein